MGSLWGLLWGCDVSLLGSQVYLADTFGLKTLDGRGALGGCVVPGVGHTGWHNHRGVYESCIRPWLT